MSLDLRIKRSLTNQNILISMPCSAFSASQFISWLCPSYSKFSRPLYEHGCSHECGAGNALHSFEINMFYFSKTLFYTHIKRYTAKFYITM